MSVVRIFLVYVWLLISCIYSLIVFLFKGKNFDLNQYFARIFSKGSLKISHIDIEFEGEENIPDQPCIFIANHQSIMDMTVFGQVYPPKAMVIGKKELKWIPVFGWLYYLGGNIMINRKKTDQAKGALSQVVDSVIKNNHSVWIFPEGTRSPGGNDILPFKKGAFHMAVSANIPVVPFVSSSLANVANIKNRNFSGGKIKVRILPPLFHKNGDVEKLKNDAEIQVRKTLMEMNTSLKVKESI